MAKTTKQSDAITSKMSEAADTYFEKLNENHERLASGFETARARSSRIADKMLEATVNGQREAINLGKTIAAEPTAYAKNMEAFMAAMTSAQERTLEVAKTVYQEQADAAAEMRASAERAYQGVQAFTKPFEGFAANWMPSAK